MGRFRGDGLDHSPGSSSRWSTRCGWAFSSLVTWLFLRARYPVSLVISSPNAPGLFDPSVPTSSWTLSSWYVGRGGAPVNSTTVNQLPGQYYQNGSHVPVAQALAQHGITGWARYIPASRFWPVQFIEAGWLLALSALLIAAIVWLVRQPPAAS